MSVGGHLAYFQVENSQGLEKPELPHSYNRNNIYNRPMFHFLLVLDGDAERLTYVIKRAHTIMRYLTGNEPALAVHHRNMALFVCRNGRHLTDYPENLPHEWRLGIGSWSGPTDIPAGVSMRSANNVLTNYDGVFCFLVGSQMEAEAHAVVDPVGRMHVYHAKPDTTCQLVSNSALALCALTKADWDLKSVREFLSRGTVFEERSLYTGVTKLAPRKVYHFSPYQIRTSELPRILIEIPSTTSDLLASFSECVTSTLTNVLARYPRPVLDLTGGFDSRLVLACMTQLRPSNEIDTVVIGNDRDRDVIVANSIARQTGFRHIHLERPIDSSISEDDLKKSLILTDGEFDIVEYSKILQIHEGLATEFDVSINGSGGELIRDEWWQVFSAPFGRYRPWNPEYLATRRFASDTWGESILADRPTNSLSRHFADIIERTVQHLDGAEITRLVDEIHLYMQTQRWQGRIASATHGIWPNYSPLIMQNALPIALQTPVTLRRHATMSRLLLKRLNRVLADATMSDGAPASPITVSNCYRYLPRYRTRFRHYGAAVKKRIQRRRELNPARSQAQQPPEMFLRLLTPRDMRSAQLYSSEALDIVIRQLHTGTLGKRYIGRLITIEKTARTLNHSAQHLDQSY